MVKGRERGEILERVSRRWLSSFAVEILVLSETLQPIPGQNPVGSTELSLPITTLPNELKYSASLKKPIMYFLSRFQSLVLCFW